MQRSLSKIAPRGRAATKEFRREQLIKSTVDSIAKRGFADTTLANVADGAGLSRGIVNFYFKSKQTLLVETLQYLADEYRSAWRRALDEAGPKPAERLRVFLLADFDPSVCNRKKIAVWYAFWGESKSRPTYLKLCGDRDLEHFEVLRSLCHAVVDEGGYEKLDSTLIAKGLGAMTDGLWLDLLIDPGRFDLASARNTCLVFLASLFPKHYDAPPA